MELQLKNIGMIKEANVKIDGLTVIAGENDTGKSTVGKAFYVVLKSLEKIYSNKIMDNKANDFIDYINSSFAKIFKKYPFPKNAFLSFKEEEYYASINRDSSSILSNLSDNPYMKKDIIFMETPLVWNFSKFFRDIALVESQMNIEVDYPPFMKDLNFKLFIKNASNGIDIRDKMISLMGGQFEQDERGDFFFNKNGKRIELENTSTGIKQFGIFQVLSQNNYLNENTILVLDEPEVHLHPKWQLEMAKIIVELVKNGVKIVVNSHSPYMIEALERYAEKAEVPADFYLAEDGFIDKIEDNNSKTLAKIFNKLSAPYETFNQMDSETLKGG